MTTVGSLHVLEQAVEGRADRLQGICGAAAVDLIARRFGVVTGEMDLGAFHGTVRTLGDAADQFDRLGLACEHTDTLDFKAIARLPADTCVVFVLPPTRTDDAAHLLIGLPSTREGFAMIDAIGPYPHDSIPIDSAMAAAWQGEALLISIPPGEQLSLLPILFCAAASCALGRLGWILGRRAFPR